MLVVEFDVIAAFDVGISEIAPECRPAARRRARDVLLSTGAANADINLLGGLRTMGGLGLILPSESSEVPSPVLVLPGSRRRTRMLMPVSS